MTHIPEYDMPNPDHVISISWSIQDVQSVREDLSDEQATEVLQYACRQHDASIGINWDVLEAIADDTFPLRTVYVALSRPHVGVGGVSAMEWRETEAEARTVYADFVSTLKSDPEGGTAVLFEYETSLTGEELTDEIDHDDVADDQETYLDAYIQQPQENA